MLLPEQAGGSHASLQLLLRLLLRLQARVRPAKSRPRFRKDKAVDVQFVEVGAHVVLATGVTAAAGMLAVLACTEGVSRARQVSQAVQRSGDSAPTAYSDMAAGKPSRPARRKATAHYAPTRP
jgi:hypothetical protein